jgi:hypothetical protein
VRLPRPPRLTVVTAILGVLTLVGLQFAGTPRRHMPSVVGETKLVALKKMAKHDLIANVVVDHGAPRRLSPRHRGKVVNQTWDRGMALPEGSRVRLTLYPRHAPRR